MHAFFQRYTWSDEQQHPFVFPPWLLDVTLRQDETASRSYEHLLMLYFPATHTVPLDLRCVAVLDAREQPASMLAIFQEVAPFYRRLSTFNGSTRL